MDTKLIIINLLDWMSKNIEYGWMEPSGKKHLSKEINGELFWNNYRLMLPQEVFINKIGVCWDQTMFENWIFSSLNVEYKLIFIQQYKLSTHSFLIYKEQGKWNYFENSFEQFRGIHKGFKSEKEVVELVYKNMCSVIQEETPSGFQWSYMNPINFSTKLSCEQFYNLVGYDYSKGE